jgi:hypothetical protein
VCLIDKVRSKGEVRVCFITTQKLVWTNLTQSSRSCDLKKQLYVCGMFQDYRCLEPPILGIQRRFRVKRQHPNAHPP